MLYVLASICLVFLCFQFEADRRAFVITINSFGTELTKDDRAKLYPRLGKLYPDGLSMLARADDYEQVRAVADYYAVSFFSKSLNLLEITQFNNFFFFFFFFFF